ncbi:SDR family NAD(P)-dependent oxidoreductase [Segniliparus rotundus]|uniref:SDR family NAD(P)-dependent oxidoreductase n=1 Tax=Segniliparus rotundus TaxID=286802 RepID=UPI0002EEEFE0|nr:SDR family NAD(P)-dependent oxidoreductase [Segniliparus rotundus]
MQFARRGAVLALSDVSLEAVEQTAEQVRGLGAKAKAYRLDVADRAAVIEHAAQARSDFGKVNVIVNNAGVAVVGSVLATPWEEHDWIIGINAHGVHNGTKAFLPHLIESGDGYVVNISSIEGLMSMPFLGSYNMSKFAVRGLTEALRQEAKALRWPIGVSSVHPGFVRTQIAKSDPGQGHKAGIAELFNLLSFTDAATAAEAIVQGVGKRKARILVGADARFYNAVPRLFGSLYSDPLGLIMRFAGVSFARRKGVELR